MAQGPTRLSVALADEASQTRVTPIDVFKHARQWWFEGRRLNLGALADEVGVSRATIFRWVGNRDLLVAEILWSMYSQTLEAAASEAQGTGVDYLVDLYRRIAEVAVNFVPLRRFLKQDPEYALRVLTSDTTNYHERIVAAWKELLDEQLEQGAIQPQMDTAELAALIVHINEGVFYSDLIADRDPMIETACKALRLLLANPCD